MEWLTDPTIWVGLLTLIVLEIVLGIDNLIFIAILVDRLPPAQQDRARKLGLSLALLMRLGLLASLAWLMKLTAPLFTVFSLEISGRDLILILGGLFLLLKATVEIHERLEAPAPKRVAETAVYSGFWIAVTQIIVLDAVFSLDSIITAVGMVDELLVMMAAVVIAVIVMLAASRPLSAFISAHPPLIILCLGFLLMVGFSLIADGLGYHIPKGYLYAAIGFSVLIETFNQIALKNRQKSAASLPPRQRTANVVLRLLGGVPLAARDASGEDMTTLAIEADKEAAAEAFAPTEKEMVRDVLALAERPVSTIMTLRPDIVWIDPDDPKETLLARIRDSKHSQLLVSRGSIDEVLGVVRKEDILELCLDGRPFDIMAIVAPPVALHEGASILDALELFKSTPVQMALVVDEYGGLQGIVTQTDLLEAIAGDLPQTQKEKPDVKQLEDGSFLVDGTLALYDAQARLDLGSLPSGKFHTLAGFVLFLLGRIPNVGEHVEWQGWRFEVHTMEGWRIDKVLARRIGRQEEPVAAASQAQ